MRMKHCRNCGASMNEEDLFCSRCGMPCYEKFTGREGARKSGGFSRLLRGLSCLTGGDGTVRFRFGDLFAEVFQKHSKEEADRIFICGTAATTPPPASLETVRPRPWLYSRVFAVFAVAFLFLNAGLLVFGSAFSLPGVVFLGAAAVPISLFVFFFEINLPKNISFFTTVKIFLIGGCASLLLSLFLYVFVPLGEEIGYFQAILIGIVEEVGKLVVVYFFLRWEKAADCAMNALLIGAAVGAGFAAFESAGYILWAALEENYSSMLQVAFLRAVLAPGGHVAWAAITGYALMYAKGEDPWSTSVFKSRKFWGLFWIPVLLHAVWDMPIPFGSVLLWLPLLLTALSWVVLLAQINAGIGQVIDRVRRARGEEGETQKGLLSEIAWIPDPAWCRAPGSFWSVPPSGFFPLDGVGWTRNSQAYPRSPENSERRDGRDPDDRFFPGGSSSSADPFFRGGDSSKARPFREAPPREKSSCEKSSREEPPGENKT